MQDANVPAGTHSTSLVYGRRSVLNWWPNVPVLKGICSLYMCWKICTSSARDLVYELEKVSAAVEINYMSSPVLARPGYEELCIPVKIHGDATPATGLGKSWSKMVEVFSVCSLLTGGGPTILRPMDLYLASGVCLWAGLSDVRNRVPHTGSTCKHEAQSVCTGCTAPSEATAALQLARMCICRFSIFKVPSFRFSDF